MNIIYKKKSFSIWEYWNNENLENWSEYWNEMQIK